MQPLSKMLVVVAAVYLMILCLYLCLHKFCLQKSAGIELGLGSLFSRTFSKAPQITVSDG